MREILYCILGGACLLFCASSFSAEYKPGFGVNYGAGVASCGMWTEQRKLNEGGGSDLLLQWVMGYLSAFNDITPNAFVKTDRDAILGFIDNYCQENPLESIKVASAVLMARLMKPRPDPAKP